MYYLFFHNSLVWTFKWIPAPKKILKPAAFTQSAAAAQQPPAHIINVSYTLITINLYIKITILRTEWFFGTNFQSLTERYWIVFVSVTYVSSFISCGNEAKQIIHLKNPGDISDNYIYYTCISTEADWCVHSYMNVWFSDN